MPNDPSNGAPGASSQESAAQAWEREAGVRTVALRAPAHVTVEQRQGSPCEHCGGVAFVTLDVTHTGYSCGSGYRHTEDCKTHFCRHGQRYSTETECEKCWLENHCPHGVGWESETGCDECGAMTEAEARNG